MNRNLFFYVFLLLGIELTSCIQQTSLYDPNATSTTNSTGVPESDIYLYPFNDESSNNVVELTISTNKALNADAIQTEIPHLKYNKEWLCLFTQDDCNHSTYAYTWASINGKPQTDSTFYDVQQLLAGDLPPDTFSYHKSLGCTDGAGNEVRFAFTTALFQENKNLNDLTSVRKGYTDNYFRFYMKSTLTWSDIRDMLNYGNGIAFHNGEDDNWSANEDSILKHYSIGQDSIIKHLSGRGSKMLADPDGNIHYINAAYRFPTIQTLTAEGNANTKVYPFKVETDLKEDIIERTFYDTPSQIKTAIIENMNTPKEQRPAITIGAHRAYDDTGKLFLWINDTYGKDGDDTVWFPCQEEYYEYCYYRNHAKITKSSDGNTLKLTVSMPSGEYFYYPSITVNLSGLKKSDIQSITTSSNVTGLSYADHKNNLMININCRTHLLDLAKHYVSVYLKSKSEDKLRDAKYFVNMLKDSDDKETLLKSLN